MKRGESLISLIILLPIIVIICLAIYDIYDINYNKIKGENIINDVAEMYKDNNTVKEIETFISLNIKDTSFVVTIEDDYTIISLEKNIDLLTPGASIFVSDPYKLKISKFLANS
jgi:hypothetical protein